MNFQRKLWWAQHKNEIYKYGTILSLVLIVTISIIYFTYSKFSSTNEATAYETTVEPFIKNDYFIASYIDGEWSDSIPGKDDGYVVDKVVCDNDAVGVWDNDKWGITITNATKKIKCGVYFKKLVKLTEQVTNLASTDTTNFASDDPDNNIRYIGKDPSNYVYFNCSDYSNQSDSTCEKWRIIGLFKNLIKSDNQNDDLIKIISPESFATFFDVDETSYNGTSNYSNSTLERLLNDNYYNSTSVTVTGYSSSGEDDPKPYISDFTSTGLKNNSTRNAIESVIWNIGGISSSDNNTASVFYSAERSSTIFSGTATTWTGKIGLPYPSDFGYATSGSTAENRENCLTKDLNTYFKDKECRENNFLLPYIYTYTLTPSWISGIYYVDYAMYRIIPYPVAYRYHAKPTLYLKSNITILGGDGSSSSPYQLNLQ